MNLSKIIYLLPLSLLPFTAAAQESADIEKVTQLNEVVVTGDNVWIEGNKVIFKPKKQAKNLATDAVSLIERMNTGLLFVDDGKIKARNGQNVEIFINGVKADGMDLATFWPKNAISVEYIENPDDPRFAGASRVVNFIMKEYVAGGLTSIDGNQTFPNDGYYSAASKLVYKKMTYNAIVSGNYNRNHISGNERTERYEDVWYDNNHYDLIERRQNADDVTRQNAVYGGLNARYRTNKLIITHSAKLEWDQNPGGYSHGSLSYNPDIISSNSMFSRSRARSLSPSVNGDYVILPGGKWAYSFGWGFNHSHNNSFSEYEEIGLDPIATHLRENVYNFSIGAFVQYNFSRGHSINLALSENRQIADGIYMGSNNSDQWQQTGNNSLRLSWQLKANQDLIFQVTPSLVLQDLNVNHSYKKTSWLPGIKANVWYTVNDKTSLYFGANYFSQSPQSSMRNDLILRETELKWLEGNPSMKATETQDYILNCYYVPFKWLNAALNVSYINTNNRSFIEYRSGGEKYDGVVGQYVALGKETQFMFSLHPTAKLFDGKLSIGLPLEYSFWKWDLAGTPRIGNWQVRPNITGYFGNCSLSASYRTPDKYAMTGGQGLRRTPCSYDIRFSYGNGNFNFSITAKDLFRKHTVVNRYFSSGPYSYDERSFGVGRSVKVTLSYTFDYGKKVTPGIDIDSKSIQTTNALGSDRP